MSIGKTLLFTALFAALAVPAALAASPTAPAAPAASDSPAPLPWTTDGKAAFAKAKAEKRFLLLYFVTPGSQSCEKMQKTFDLSPVIEALGDFVKVRLDAKENREYALPYRIQQTPAVIYFDSQGRELDWFSGHVDFRTLLERSAEAVDPKTNYVKLKERLRTNPADAEALYYMGFKYARRKDFDRAEQYFAKAEKTDKDAKLAFHDNLRLRRAEDMERRGETEQALAYIQDFRQKYPQSDEADTAEILRARLLMLLGRTVEAAQVYEKFLQEFPDSLRRPMAESALQALRAMAGGPAAASLPAVKQ